MKVAIPADTQSLDSDVCPSFGRAPYYLIYDIGSKPPVFLANKAVHSQGGAGIQAAQFLVDQHIQAVLTPRCGRNAAEVIQAAGIRIYQTMAGSLRENLDAFSADKLGVMEEFHAGFHRHGGR